MLYIIVALLVVIVVLSALLNGKRRCFMSAQDMPSEDLECNIKELAMSLRMPERAGNAPDINRIKSRIKRAQAIISKKIAIDNEVYAFEKWLYENYYYNISRLNNRVLTNFALLPHKNKQPRILIFADFVLRACKYKLSREFVCNCIEIFNKFTPLYFEELTALPDALAFCVLQKVGELCQKSSKFYRMERAARRKIISKRLAKNDSYLYFLKRNGRKVELEEKRYGDINDDYAEMSFYATVAESEKYAQSAITTLKNLSVMLTEDVIFNLSFVAKLMMNDSVYKSMDTASKGYYLNVVSELSSLYNVSEKNVVETAFELASQNNLHFGNVLFDHKLWIKYAILGIKGKEIKEKNRNNQLYIMTCCLINVVLSVVAALVFWGRWQYFAAVILLGLVAFIKLAELCCNKFFNLFLSTRPVPRMNFDTVPNYAKTTVCVSHLIASEIDLKEAIFNIEKIAAVNKDDNIEFCLLIDYPPSSEEVDSNDAVLNKKIEAEITNKKINAYVRKRTFNGTKYCAKERKRGAIEALNKLFVEGNDDDFAYILHRDYFTPTYVVLLDADNEMTPSFVRKVVNVMLHPANTQYDLFAFKSKYKLSSIKSLYSKKFAFEAGAESYNNYSDFYYNLSGCSVFCGKGIYRLSSFYEKLKGRLPENRVLSHDVIEGALLDTASFNEVIYEDAPSNFFAETERANRWMRGDLQLLPFAKSTAKNSKNEKIIIKKPLIYNYIMTSNAFSALSTIAVFVAMLLAVITSPWFLLLPAIYFLLPLFLATLAAVNKVNNSTRARYAFKELAHIWIWGLFDILLLPFFALNNLIVVTMTAFRMLRGKKLLEWKTFKSVQGDSGTKALALFLPSVIMMLLLSIILFNTYYAMGYTLAFYLTICIVCISGKVKAKCVKSPTGVDNSYLLVCAKNTYNYFAELSGKHNNYLIPDNYQLSPFKGAAERTSPTNIGFLLLSHICACKLELIALEECFGKLSNTLTTLKAIRKYKGNLYNWYDTKTLDVLEPNTVSSVDSANLAAALLTVVQFANEYGNKTIELEAKRLFNNMDLQLFYDNERGLFRIAYDVQNKNFEGYYDMLASEARLLSFIAVAKGCKPAAWHRLSRECTLSRGNTLLSWSGTMFEYLLPQLFLEDIEGSLLTTSVKNAVAIQAANKCNGVFGVSESAYYKFDDDLNYQYYAYGLEQLSLRTEFNRCVISPYSTMLALPYQPKKCFDNLMRLKREGLWGRYGYFEAVDFNGSKNIIYSHMAHHQGMTLCSITNFLADDCIKRYFNSNRLIAGAKMLLEEAHSVQRGSRARKGEYIYPEQKEDFCRCYKNHLQFPIATVLSSGDYSVVIDQNGNGYSQCNGINITRFKKDIYRKQGVFCYFRKGDGTLFSSKFSPLTKDAEFCEATFDAVGANFKNNKEGVEENIVLPLGINGELRTFKLSNDSDKEVMLDYAIYAELCLNSYDADFSHTVFDNMFIKTYLENDFIVAKRTPREKEGGYFAAMGVFGVDFKPCTARVDFIGRLSSPQSPQIFDADITTATGDVLDACLGAYGTIKIPPNSQKEFYCVILADKTVEGLRKQMDRVLDNSFYDFAMSNAAMQYGKSASYLRSSRQKQLCSNLATKLIYEPYSIEKLQGIANYDLLSHIEDAGLNKSVKTIYFDISAQTAENVEDFLRVYAYLNNCGILCNLFLVCGDGECAAINNYARDFLLALGVAERVKYITAKGTPTDFITRLKTACFCEVSGNLDLDMPMLSQLPFEKSQPVGEDEGELVFPQIAIRSGNGGFDAAGNYIVKSKRPTALPYSNVIAAKYGGTIVTENGGGFTFGANSREDKLTEFSNSPIDDVPSEGVYWVEKGFSTRVNKGFGKNACTVHSTGKTNHISLHRGIKTDVGQYVVQEGKSKIFEVEISNFSKNSRCGDIVIKLEPSLFWHKQKQFLYSETTSYGIKVTNAFSKKSFMFKSLCDANAIVDNAALVSFDMPKKVTLAMSNDKSNFNNSAAALSVRVSLDSEASKKIYFVLSACEEEFNSLTEQTIEREKRISEEYFKSIKCFNLNSGNLALDAMFNVWLPTQVVCSRLNSKCGYYQAGGAIGFRDQLQDCLAMLYIDSHYVKKHIMLCAAHQFEEGDVQHWWHPPYFGVRTNISDDMLFLPFLTARYIAVTGDVGILEEITPFITARKPNKGEEGALENAKPLDEGVSLKQHIIAAINRALRFGEHDLLLIGSGDWNDALNGIGDESKGESVWLSMFAYYVIGLISPYLEDDERKKYGIVCQRLKVAVMHCFENGRFKRAFTKDGEWLGSDSVKSASLDLICQAFAVISDIADKEKADSAICEALKLVDFDKGIIKLFSPPFDGDKYYGYISRYPQGVRENGGQYTHAAAWLIKAFAMSGDLDRAFELFCLINPAQKCTDSTANQLYKGEPYVFAGDVYTNKDNFARAGWSWYTGSAAWLYVVLLEDILGVSIERGCLVFRAVLPSTLQNPTLSYRYGTSEYNITFIKHDSKKILLNGIESSVGGKLAIPLSDNGKSFDVKVFYIEVN